MKTPISIVSILLSAASLPASNPATGEAIARGDAAWSRRAEGRLGAQPDPAPIGMAVAAYEEALAAAPESLEARWKLMRALYFEGEYVLVDRDSKLAIYLRGRELSDEARGLLAERVGRPALEQGKPTEISRAVADEPHAAAVHFWSAVHWGLWGRHRGVFAAARQGIAKKIRNFAEITIQVDENLENAGGHRILGRLHAEAPKIPFFTGWIDRDLAVSELERAVELAPEDLLSRFYLAEALLEHHPKRRGEALELLRDLAAHPPDPAFVVEDEKTLADVRALLVWLGG